jgi:hypothetical protein
MKIFNKVALAAITGTILLSPAVAAQNTKSVLAADKALLVQGVIVAGVVAAGLVVLDDGINTLTFDNVNLPPAPVDPVDPVDPPTDTSTTSTSTTGISGTDGTSNTSSTGATGTN